MHNKRGQELSVGTTILIAIGIIILVLLVIGFSIGWEDLFSKINIFKGSDLSAMVAACKVAVASDSKTSFCECKSVKIEGVVEEIHCGDPKVVKYDSTLQSSKDKFGCLNACT